MTSSPVVLVTGAAHRLGAAISRALHKEGYRVALHYHHSSGAAQSLCDELNQVRPDSCAIFQADLCAIPAIEHLCEKVLHRFARVDAVVNNASSFYPTPLVDADGQQWDDLMGTNLKGPFFLSRALAPELSARGGRILNIADINGYQPLADYPIYSIAKAGNIMLTKALALELAPNVQVNGIAPGSILWPEGNATMSEQTKADTLARIPLGRLGTEADIAQLATLLITRPGYMTGEIIAVDGGQKLSTRNN